MPSHLSWRSLLPGLAAAAVVVMLAIGVVVYAGRGGFRDDTIRLYALTDQARGVLGGTQVWLVGQEIGKVEEVGFKPPATDTGWRVVIAMNVNKRAAAAIRRDSHVQVRTGATFLGPVIVAIEPGTPQSSAIAEGDTLTARPQPDPEIAGERLIAVTSDLPALMSDFRKISASVRGTEGTLGAFLHEAPSGQVDALRKNVTALRNSLRGNSAARGVMPRVRAALARVDSVRSLLRSDGNAFGRFRRDSTFIHAIAALRDELTELNSLLESEDGTVGRLGADSALANSVSAARREMTRLFDDVRRRPLRYISF